MKHGTDKSTKTKKVAPKKNAFSSELINATSKEKHEIENKKTAEMESSLKNCKGVELRVPCEPTNMEAIDGHLNVARVEEHTRTATFLDAKSNKLKHVSTTQTELKNRDFILRKCRVRIERLNLKQFEKNETTYPSKSQIAATEKLEADKVKTDKKRKNKKQSPPNIKEVNFFSNLTSAKKEPSKISALEVKKPLDTNQSNLNRRNENKYDEHLTASKCKDQFDQLTTNKKASPSSLPRKQELFTNGRPSNPKASNISPTSFEASLYRAVQEIQTNLIRCKKKTNKNMGSAIEDVRKGAISFEEKRTTKSEAVQHLPKKSKQIKLRKIEGSARHSISPNKTEELTNRFALNIVKKTLKSPNCGENQSKVRSRHHSQRKSKSMLQIDKQANLKEGASILGKRVSPYLTYASQKLRPFKIPKKNSSALLKGTSTEVLVHAVKMEVNKPFSNDIKVARSANLCAPDNNSHSQSVEMSNTLSDFTLTGCKTLELDDDENERVSSNVDKVLTTTSKYELLSSYPKWNTEEHEEANTSIFKEKGSIGNVLPPPPLLGNLNNYSDLCPFQNASNDETQLRSSSACNNSANNPNKSPTPSLNNINSFHKSRSSRSVRVHCERGEVLHSQSCHDQRHNWRGQPSVRNVSQTRWQSDKNDAVSLQSWNQSNQYGCNYGNRANFFNTTLQQQDYKVGQTFMQQNAVFTPIIHQADSMIQPFQQGMQLLMPINQNTFLEQFLQWRNEQNQFHSNEDIENFKIQQRHKNLSLIRSTCLRSLWYNSLPNEEKQEVTYLLIAGLMKPLMDYHEKRLRENCRFDFDLKSLNNAFEIARILIGLGVVVTKNGEMFANESENLQSHPMPVTNFIKCNFKEYTNCFSTNLYNPY